MKTKEKNEGVSMDKRKPRAAKNEADSRAETAFSKERQSISWYQEFVEIFEAGADWGAKAAEARIRELGTALRFYSDPKNFSGVYRDPETDEIVAETDSIEMDVTEHPNGEQQEFGMHALEVLRQDGKEKST